LLGLRVCKGVLDARTALVGSKLIQKSIAMAIFRV
jgi:hypothetical protein